jgi:hypothetical protein
VIKFCHEIARKEEKGGGRDERGERGREKFWVVRKANQILMLWNRALLLAGKI